MSAPARVMLRDHLGPRGWEVDVPGAHIARPLRPDDPHSPYPVRATHGDCLRVLWRDEEDVVEVTVGEQDETHWHALRLPAHALDAVVALLDEVWNARYRRAEEVALGRGAGLPAECPW